ncbi:MAG: J domain-containing protein [Proteobacteria bacterium]|nr:J domain-containing protein [Pseudomonadota bacterium]
MNSDLASLYSQLDLRPGCSFEEFQRAYRRQIAQLHPDRGRTDPGSSDTQARLRNLILLHATVSRFHHRYGRMPGGRSPRISGVLPRRSHQVRHVGHAAASHPGSDRRPARFAVGLLIIGALVAMVAAWNWLVSTGRDSTAHLLPPPAAVISSSRDTQHLPRLLAATEIRITARRA